MTTIAWDGKTLAADKQMTWNDKTPYSCTKISKVTREGKTFIFGGCGSFIDLEAFRLHAEGLIPQPKIESLEILLIDEDLRVWTCEGDLIYIPVFEKFCVIGSGGPFALSAMACGKTSKEAVEIATKYDIRTGFGVDTLTF